MAWVSQRKRKKAAEDVARDERAGDIVHADVPRDESVSPSGTSANPAASSTPATPMILHSSLSASTNGHFHFPTAGHAEGGWAARPFPLDAKELAAIEAAEQHMAQERTSSAKKDAARAALKHRASPTMHTP